MGTENEKPPKAQSWALWAALAAYITFLGIYLLSRDFPYVQIRSDGAAWGQFGDYVGGVINPVVGLITIWLLTASLKQSQKEMALTRKALEDTEASQKATEATLREQLKVSEHARDLNNAIALYGMIDQQYSILQSELETAKRALNKGREYEACVELNRLKPTRDALNAIILKEHSRLFEKDSHSGEG